MANQMIFEVRSPAGSVMFLLHEDAQRYCSQVNSARMTEPGNQNAAFVFPRIVIDSCPFPKSLEDLGLAS